MSGSRTLKYWIGRKQALEAADASEARAVDKERESSIEPRKVQLNVHVPEEVKHRFRQIAAREHISMRELFFRMMQLYEQAHEEKHDRSA
jgi:predicted HicB family RNase H-like nuclease